MDKMNEIMINVTMWINSENIPSERSHTENHPDHAHLVHFQSSKFFKVRKSPSDGSKKRKLNSNRKIHFHKAGAAGES